MYIQIILYIFLIKYKKYIKWIKYIIIFEDLWIILLNPPKSKSGVIWGEEEAEFIFILKWYSLDILIITNDVIIDIKGENNLFNNKNKDGSFNDAISLAEDY